MTEGDKDVLAGIVTAIIGSAAFLYLGFAFLPPVIPVLPEPLERLSYLIKWEAFAGLTLAAGIAKTAYGRFFARASGAEDAASSDARYVTNTAEQLLLALIAHAALVMVIEPTAMRAVPVLILWFVIARITYWFGCHNRPTAQAFGLAATFWPTAAVLVFDIYRLF